MSKTRSVAGLVASAVILAWASAPAAWAGECPAASVKDDATPAGPSAPKGVTDNVISSIDLGQGYGIEGRQLRARRLVIEPGGIVPWHGHGERPANIYVLEGQITEFRSNCAVPIVHKKGEVVAEKGAISHWWRNDSRRKVVLLSSDILPPSGKPEESM